MNKKQYILLYFLILLFGFQSRAQIGLYLIPNTSDTINNGQTWQVFGRLKNLSSSTYTGPIDFGLRISGDDFSNDPIFFKPPYSGNTITLQSGDSIPALFQINISHPLLTVGQEIVVVWPIVNSPVTDSIVFALYVKEDTTVGIFEENLDLKVGQKNGKLFIQGLDKNDLFLTKLFTIEGRESNITFDDSGFSNQEAEKGVFLLVISKNGRIFRKLICISN